MSNISRKNGSTGRHADNRNVVYWHVAALVAVHHLGRYWTTTDKGQFWPAMAWPSLTQRG